MDVTEEAGVGDEGYGMGMAVGDYDNDGDLDLYVTNFGPNRLYRNDGAGRFTESDSIPSEDRWSTSAAFFDYDRRSRMGSYCFSSPKCEYLNWFTSPGLAHSTDFCAGPPCFCGSSPCASSRR